GTGAAGRRTRHPVERAERDRPLDGGDVPDLQPGPGRHPAGGRLRRARGLPPAEIAGDRTASEGDGGDRHGLESASYGRRLVPVARAAAGEGGQGKGLTPSRCPYTSLPPSQPATPRHRKPSTLDPRSEEHTSELQSRENLVC